MTKYISLLAILTLALGTMGCATDSANAKRQGVAGAAAGAIVGGIIGHQSGRGLEGAAVGAAAGGAGGAILGSAKDEENK